MLKLSEAQLAQLDALEGREYVAQVRKKILSEFSEFESETGFGRRLEQAYKYAVGVGFKDGPSITQFLYLEAFAPGFYQQPAIQAWLSKSGQSVEQRFADLNAQMKSKLKEF